MCVACTVLSLLRASLASIGPVPRPARVLRGVCGSTAISCTRVRTAAVARGVSPFVASKNLQRKIRFQSLKFRFVRLKRGVKWISGYLFLPAVDLRSRQHGDVRNPGGHGYFWCSTPNSTGSAWRLRFNSAVVDAGSTYFGFRAWGVSVRCVQ